MNKEFYYNYVHLGDACSTMTDNGDILIGSVIIRPLHPVQLGLAGLDHVDEEGQGLFLNHWDGPEVPHKVL